MEAHEIIGLIAFAVFVSPWFIPALSPDRDRAGFTGHLLMAEARARYNRGEISKEEFEETLAIQTLGLDRAHEAGWVRPREK